MATDNSSLNNPKGGGTGTADLKTSGFSQMDDQVDPQEYARLLDLYDNSFRNIAAHFRLSNLYRRAGRTADAQRELDAFNHYQAVKNKIGNVFKQLAAPSVPQ